MARKSCLNRGKVFTGELAALPGVSDRLVFGYRKATYEDVERYLEDCKKGAAAATAATWKLLKKYLAHWDEVDADDKEQPISEATLAEFLSHKEANEIVGHIQGYVSSGEAAKTEKN